MINVLEFRPVVCGNECTTTAVSFCEPRHPDPDYPGQRRYKSGFRRKITGTANGGIYDFLTGCKFPHGMAVLAALLAVVACVVILVMLIVGEVNKLMADQIFIKSLDDFVDEPPLTIGTPRNRSWGPRTI